MGALVPRKKKLPDEPVPSMGLWLVRRIRRHDGILLAKPTLWGKVPASSDTAAIHRFISITKASFNPAHFDAIPFASGGTHV